jgi:hypothetical protein
MNNNSGMSATDLKNNIMFLKTLSYRNYACGEGRAIQ